MRYAPGGFKEFLVLAYPLILSNASMTIMHFMDRLFLSWYGPEEIAASLPAGILAFTFLYFFIGVSQYTNTFVAQYYGANRYSLIGMIVWQGVFFSLIGGLFSLLLLPVGIRFFDWAGLSPDIVHLQKIYFTTIYTGGVFFILNGALSSFFSGRGKTFSIMVITITANVINAILDYGLIFGVWGFPRWGIRGAAVATVVSTAFMSFIYLILILHSSNDRIFYTRKTFRFDGDMMLRLLRYGTPTGIQFVLDIGAFTAFVFLIGRLGNVELAASNIVLSINSLAFWPMEGASIATATLIGQYIGRNNYRIAEKSAYTALIAVETYMLFFALIYFLFPQALMELFRGDNPNTTVSFTEVVHYGSQILILVALYQISDAVILTFSGVLRGAGDTTFAMWTSVCCSWLFFVPGIYLVLSVFKLGVIAAWIWATIYLTLLGFIYIKRFRSGYWKTINLMSKTGH
jgi:MATE family multidrug resistance protein